MCKIKIIHGIYKIQIKACNNTAHHILKNNVDLILPKFPKGQKNKRRIFSAISAGFIGLAFKGISSFLHNKKHKALQNAVKGMLIKTYIQRNKLMHLENSLVMNGIYDAETLGKLVKSSSCVT